jgi:hypothetical protein
MSILPNANMISNVGFNQNATQVTGGSELANLAKKSMGVPITHPIGRFKNIKADQFTEVKCIRVPLIKRVRNKLSGGLR